MIIPAFSFSPFSSVIPTSVGQKRPATKKYPCPRVITEESLWGKVTSSNIRSQVRPLQACIWDLSCIGGLQLPHCKLIIYNHLRLGPQLSRFYWSRTLWVKEFEVSCWWSDFHNSSYVFLPPEIRVHWTLWEDGTGAQVSAVAYLHWCEYRECRTVPSSCPHATLYPSKWVLF